MPSMITLELWDFESWHALTVRRVQVAREAGALVQLQFALNSLGLHRLLAGEVSAAARLVEEDRLIAEATGNPPVGYAALMLAAWQGREQEASKLIDATVQIATERGTGRLAGLAACASAVLYNGLGRYDAARDAARQAFKRDQMALGRIVVAELAEAAARTGDTALVKAALDWLSERSRVTRTAWVLGIEARVRALLSDGQTADGCYRDSIERLGQAGVRAELARSHLLYGEWLRRQGRRTEAREQLRTACRMLQEMGMAAFAERARRELVATGETLGRGSGTTTSELTPQEVQITRLARDGRSNREIGTLLFLSPRTVEWHLRKAFIKLGISSRGALHAALPP